MTTATSPSPAHNYAPPVNRRNHWHPCLADVAAGTAVELDEDIDAEVGNYGVSDQRPGLSNVSVRWAPGDKWFYFLLTERGAANLWRGDTTGSSERLISGDSTVFEYSPASSDLAAYGQADPSSPGELYLWHDGASERLSDLNPWLRDLQLAQPESYEYTGLDGVPVHAWLQRPLAFAPATKLPAGALRALLHVLLGLQSGASDLRQHGLRRGLLQPTWHDGRLRSGVDQGQRGRPGRGGLRGDHAGRGRSAAPRIHGSTRSAHGRYRGQLRRVS